MDRIGFSVGRPVGGSPSQLAHGCRSVAPATERGPNRVPCAWQPGHPLTPTIVVVHSQPNAPLASSPSQLAHSFRPVARRTERRPNRVFGRWVAARASPSQLAHGCRSVGPATERGPNRVPCAWQPGHPFPPTIVVGHSQPHAPLASSPSQLAHGFGSGAGASGRGPDPAWRGCSRAVRAQDLGGFRAAARLEAWWAWAPSNRPSSVARARRPVLGVCPVALGTWRARFPFVPPHQASGLREAWGLGRTGAGSGGNLRGARGRGGRDESVRRGAGSQWIVAARPLCHLQCPVAYLSRLQRIQPAARWEGSFEAAGRGASAGPAWPVARALGGLRP